MSKHNYKSNNKTRSRKSRKYYDSEEIDCEYESNSEEIYFDSNSKYNNILEWLERVTQIDKISKILFGLESSILIDSLIEKIKSWLNEIFSYFNILFLNFKTNNNINQYIDISAIESETANIKVRVINDPTYSDTIAQSISYVSSVSESKGMKYLLGILVNYAPIALEIYELFYHYSKIYKLWILFSMTIVTLCLVLTIASKDNVTKIKETMCNILLFNKDTFNFNYFIRICGTVSIFSGVILCIKFLYFLNPLDILLCIYTFNKTHKSVTRFLEYNK
jgi:hypothetical protein